MMWVTILIFLAVLGILVFVHELGHFLAAKANGVRVDDFAFGYGPTIFKKKVGETTYALNILPLGGFVKMYGEDASEQGPRSFLNLGAISKLQILFAGGLMNLLLAWVILTVLFVIGFDPLFGGVGQIPFEIKGQEINVNKISVNSPAESSGMMANDKIIKVGDQKITSGLEFIQVISTKKGETTQVTVIRDGRENVLSLVPRVNPPAGEGAIGVTLESTGKVKAMHPWQAPIVALFGVGSFIIMSIKGFYDFVMQLFVHQKVSEDVTGIVGVGALTGMAVKLGFSYLAQLVAIVSAGLGVINLMPILPLDGGHVLVLAIEKTFRRKLTEKQQGALFFVGLGFIIFVFLVVTYKDIIRFNLF